MVVIVDYEAGNLTSVKRAFDHIGVSCVISSDATAVAAAERVVFPGVGHAAAAMAALRRHGLDKALRSAFERGVPILGVCLGTQIILSHSDEGDVPCLGLVPGKCPKFSGLDQSLKIPHMGWNGVKVNWPHPLLDGVEDGDEFYFVHSYYPAPEDSGNVLATAEHGIEFAAVIGVHNLFATQFHPEKSGRLGLELLRRFSVWDGNPGVEPC